MIMATTPCIPVVIIGAGLSGLSAAARLSQAGISFQILEALPRAGGRVCTAVYKGKSYELGATWFHGTEGNAAYDIAIQGGIIRDEVVQGLDEEGDYGEMVFGRDGVWIKDGIRREVKKEVMLDVVRRYRKGMKEIEREGEGIGKEVGVLEYLKEYVGWEGMSGIEREIFRRRDMLESCVNGCEKSTEQVSARYWGRYEELRGDNVQCEKGGMQQVVNILLGRIGEGDLRLKCRVCKIEWGGEGWDKNILVEIENGERIETQYVIWTAGVNASKKAIEAGLFQPELPGWKLDALDGIGMGVIEHVHIVLKHSSTATTIPNSLNGVGLPIIWETEQWYQWIYCITYDKARHAFSMWVCAGATLSKMERNARIQECERAVRTIIGVDVEVEEVLLEDWSKDPFYGCYSYAKRGYEFSAGVWQEPAGGVLFAGEGSHERFFSTMHGAVESGVREALRCIRYFKTRG